MNDNRSWESLLEGLTGSELFYMATSRKYSNAEDRLARDVAQRTLNLPVTDFEFGRYVDFIAGFVDRSLRNEQNYRARKFEMRGVGEFTAVTALELNEAIDYLMQLQIAHRVTEGIAESRRLQLLAGSRAWDSIAQRAQIYKAFQTEGEDLNATIWDIKEQREKRFGEYDFILDKHEADIIASNEGMPKETKEAIWERSSDAMKRTGYNLGGGTGGNQLIRVAYSLGQRFPAGLKGECEFSIYDEELLDKVEAKGTLKQGDELFLSPYNYALITLRQNTKGLSNKIITGN